MSHCLFPIALLTGVLLGCSSGNPPDVAPQLTPEQEQQILDEVHAEASAEAGHKPES